MAGAMTPELVARAAFRLAQLTYEAQRAGGDITEADVHRLADEFGPEAVGVVLRVQAQLMDEEAAALQADSAIRSAKGTTR